MTRQQIQAIQEKIGTTPDGFWGPKSIAACQKYLRSLMPKPNPWPKSDTRSLNAFYGDPAKGEVAPQLVKLDVRGIGLRYDSKPVSSINVHRKCAESLGHVLEEVSKLAPTHSWVLQQYAGVYNHRPMRGGTRWSLHAYGAAIDLAPGTNGLNTHWPTRSTMPLEVMECFAREGWLPAGAFWSRDAMHFQATR
jgi:hypothetical protein